MTSRIRFSPSAATRFGVNPNSEMREAMAASATASTTTALAISSSCRPSNRLGGAKGSRADAEYSTRPTTSTSSRSNAISTLRWMSIGRPVQAIVARNTSRRMVKSGVNSRVSTGAMFSITLCFASTSQEATSSAPMPPQGTSQSSASQSAFMPMALNIITVNEMSTSPPRAMRT